MRSSGRCRRQREADDDGVSDVREAGGEDHDGDGMLDDALDADADGLADSVQADAGAPLPLPDRNRNGVPDFRDSAQTAESGAHDGGCAVVRPGSTSSALPYLLVAIALWIWCATGGRWRRPIAGSRRSHRGRSSTASAAMGRSSSTSTAATSATIPDRPGYLGTPIAHGGSPAQQADLAAALLGALGIARVTAVGISAGGPRSPTGASKGWRRIPARARWRS